MNNEEQILARLERMEESLAPLVQSAQGVQELRDDLAPRLNEMARQMIEGLSGVEAAFQLEDLMELGKRMLRSVRDLNFMLIQLENLVDFVVTVEPLLKTSVPRLIAYLGELEEQGVFSMLKSLSDPKTFSFLQKMAELPSHLDLAKSKPIGPLGMLGAAGDPAVKEGMGVMIELTKAMGKLKE